LAIVLVQQTPVIGFDQSMLVGTDWVPTIAILSPAHS
jgi:hypothetical protein